MHIINAYVCVWIADFREKNLSVFLERRILECEILGRDFGRADFREKMGQEKPRFWVCRFDFCLIYVMIWV